MRLAERISVSDGMEHVKPETHTGRIRAWRAGIKAAQVLGETAIANRLKELHDDAVAALARSDGASQQAVFVE